MAIILSVLGVLLLAQQPMVSSDDRAGELRSCAVAITSIDPADDDDFSDLQPLKKLIGDARLVVLGEQSHGDGAVFYAKARLIKFLHQEMGFDVLTWESGMYDCREVDRALRDPAISMDDIKDLGIFQIWTYSAQVLPTLEYVRSTLTTEHPIETAGFDHQFSGKNIASRAAALTAFFDKADAHMLSPQMRDDIIGGFARFNERGADGRPDPARLEPLIDKWAAIAKLMDERRDDLIQAHGEAEFEFMRRCADDAVVSVRSMLVFLAGRDQMKVTDNNLRDERMAENLIWQVNERYKDRKIIAWMATMHAVHDVEKIAFSGNEDFYKGVTNCGTVAHKVIGEKMYTIGFTAFDGVAGNVWNRNPTTPLIPPPSGSLEDLCNQTGRQFLFIDFKSAPNDHWLREPLVSRPLGYGLMTAEWDKQIDAMFYIKTMFPSTRENMLPPYAVTREE